MSVDYEFIIDNIDKFEKVSNTNESLNFKRGENPHQKLGIGDFTAFKDGDQIEALETVWWHTKTNQWIFTDNEDPEPGNQLIYKAGTILTYKESTDEFTDYDRYMYSHTVVDNLEKFKRIHKSS